MDVQIISHTPDALNLLLKTKNTRLSVDAEDPKDWTPEKKQEHLDYMRGTIQSSWEFVNFVFQITGVSRAFTHQLVRHRTGSYAQQSQRTVDMAGFDFVTPKSLSEAPEVLNLYAHVNNTRDYYKWLIDHGTPPQDARSILPTNVSTSIIASYNLRTLADMAKLRLCTRTQGEFQDVFRLMRQRVIDIYPWAEPFIRVYCAATGVCCFPNFTECPIKPTIFNPDTGYRWDNKYKWGENDSKVHILDRPSTREEIQEIWEDTRFEAVPHVKS